MLPGMPETVAILRVPDYRTELLEPAVARLLESTGFEAAPGDRVLVKPNLISGGNAARGTTHPLVVRAACAWLLDHGARVTVADSPAFGPAAHVARASGLDQALKDLGLTVRNLALPVPLPLTLGGTVGLSRDALETDRILNLPKLKAHCQMTVTCAVKNLFGCVVGFRKALAHYKLGHSHEVFLSMIMDVYRALPQAAHLMDAVRAMHRDGPVKGEPFALNMLAASKNGVALDTMACALLGLSPQQVPLWEEAETRGMDGATPARLAYPLETPEGFDAAGFEFPEPRELSFTPTRLIRGRLRSLLKHLAKN
jgi:uncharacterized protein (DUF362 family)